MCVIECVVISAVHPGSRSPSLKLFMVLLRLCPGQRELGLFRSEFSSGLEGGDAGKKKKKRRRSFSPSGEEEDGEE